MISSVPILPGQCDLWGCGCVLLLGGMESPWWCSEMPVPQCDAGELGTYNLLGYDCQTHLCSLNCLCPFFPQEQSILTSGPWTLLPSPVPWIGAKVGWAEICALCSPSFSISNTSLPVDLHSYYFLKFFSLFFSIMVYHRFLISLVLVSSECHVFDCWESGIRLESPQNFTGCMWIKQDGSDGAWPCIVVHKGHDDSAVFKLQQKPVEFD